MRFAVSHVPYQQTSRHFLPMYSDSIQLVAPYWLTYPYLKFLGKWTGSSETPAWLQLLLSDFTIFYLEFVTIQSQGWTPNEVSWLHSFIACFRNFFLLINLLTNIELLMVIDIWSACRSTDNSLVQSWPNKVRIEKGNFCLNLQIRLCFSFTALAITFRYSSFNTLKVNVARIALWLGNKKLAAWSNLTSPEIPSWTLYAECDINHKPHKITV